MLARLKASREPTVRARIFWNMALSPQN